MIIKEIINRRCIREFAVKPVSDEDISEIIKAAQFAPSARNNHALEFIVVKGQETKDKICVVVGQEFVKKAQVLIIPAVDPKKTTCPVQDIAVAVENMLLQATALGLGAAWKAIREPEWADKVKDLLGMPRDFFLDVIVPLGHPNETKTPHTDSEFDKGKIHFEKY